MIISAYVCGLLCCWTAVWNLWQTGCQMCTFLGFSYCRDLHTKKTPQPLVVHRRSSPHALSLLARLQPVPQRSLHLRQVRYGDVQRPAGGRGGGEVVGVFPPIDEQKDSGDRGALRRCGHGVKFHTCQLNAAQQNSGFCRAKMSSYKNSGSHKIFKKQHNMGFQQLSLYYIVK